MSTEILGSRLAGATLVVDTDAGPETYDEKFLVAALLLNVARGNGLIEPEESAQIIDLLERHFNLAGAESLELITRVMSELDDKPALIGLLMDLAPTLSDAEKENIALMGLQVVAADGRRDVAEMEKFNDSMEAMGIAEAIVHRAFDRYFAETMPDL